MNREQRAARFAALGDPSRLAMVDALYLNDLTPRQLGEVTGMTSNLVSHHLGVLEEAGLIERTASGGDARRRYVRLTSPALALVDRPLRRRPGSVLFLCRGNSARSQLAEGAWRSSSEVTVQSAGIAPAEEVHPAAMAAARNAGISLAGQRPKGFSDVSGDPDLVVTVCDITGEGEIPFRGSRLHWSIPDPVGSDDPEAFDGALREIEIRVRSLVEHIEGERR